MKKNFTSVLNADTTEEATKMMLSDPTGEDTKGEKLRGYCIHLKESTFKKLKLKAIEEDVNIKDIIIRAIENELKK